MKRITSAPSNSKGENLPTVPLERHDGDKHRYHTASTPLAATLTAASALNGMTPNDAKEKSELIGEDDNPKRLRHTYPNQEAAEQAAKAEMNRVKRGKATLQFTLALGRPDITPMMGVHISSLKAPIGDTDWIIVKTMHSVTAQGFITQLEMETRKFDGENRETVI
ncbi:hypothetical protein ACO0LC_12370 [Undibacterium sp. JH2W]|uniref:hypothetical protein n=1 Tax=Undibacterium sp. JH2W TaxID=3413037 RepID=UPI003BF43273